jgi:hypothetical protein
MVMWVRWSWCSMDDLTLHEENLIWHAQRDSLPLRDLDEWIKTVSKMLWAIRTGQGVELELPATPHVPYLDN